jgi:uncharacterized protein YciI
MYPKHLLVALMLLSCQFTFSQSSNQKKPEDMIRRYWFVLLTKGEQRSQDSVAAANIQAGHMQNIKKLYGDGKIKVAGPFGKDDSRIPSTRQALFDCDTREEVERLLQTDPAIAAGRLAYEIKPWFTAPTGSFVPGKPKSE